MYCTVNLILATVLIHSVDLHSWGWWWLLFKNVSPILEYSLFKISQSKKNQVIIMIAGGGTVGLAEGIIDLFCHFLLDTFNKKYIDYETFKKYFLTFGRKVMTLYFWFRMTFGGNFWTQSRPIQTVRDWNSFFRQHHFQNMLQLLWFLKCRKIRLNVIIEK